MQNYMNYNPMATPQQRLMQLEQQQQFNRGFSIIPVTNEQEAYAAQIDILSGMPSFFWNQNAGEIYLKQINQYGKADFIKFAKQNEPVLNENVSKNTNTYEEDFKALNAKIDGLVSSIKTLLAKAPTTSGGAKNAK